MKLQLLIDVFVMCLISFEIKSKPTPFLFFCRKKTSMELMNLYQNLCYTNVSLEKKNGANHKTFSTVVEKIVSLKIVQQKFVILDSFCDLKLPRYINWRF